MLTPSILLLATAPPGPTDDVQAVAMARLIALLVVVAFVLVFAVVIVLLARSRFTRRKAALDQRPADIVDPWEESARRLPGGDGTGPDEHQSQSL